MNGRLKPISEQVVVVSGAGAGLGLAAARKAAQAGAAVVLAGADDVAVRKACEALAAAGGRVHAVVADPATAEGCERIARAAAARFDRIDSWIDAGGADRGLALAAEALARHLTARGGQGALVGFGWRLPKAAAAELRRSRGAVAATLIGLPRGVREAGLTDAPVEAALYALTHPMGRMIVAPRGRRLTALTEVSKHRGVVLGVGLLALAGVAVWLGRGRIGEVARPRVARAVRPLVAQAVRRRPLQAAKLAAKHPRQAARLARILR
jgi:NAD(P)-dependent dehydrogenase (short-subunit alcohol dehydrogenase family)